ncbi:hypothetical protein TNCV_2549761 [Trichonephila clavipes]|nr:hypothetical protein TNCV_2549761 [Trichonephila clavipes]
MSSSLVQLKTRYAKGQMYIKYVEAHKRSPVGVEVRRGASLGVFFITRPWFKITRSVANIPRAALEKRRSVCFWVSRPRLPVGLTPVQIFGQPVPWVRVAKYLGLNFLDAKLTLPTT